MRCLKKYPARILFSTILLVQVSVSLYSQKKDYRFNYYTTEEGLTQNMVDCIFKDSRGFMWFGTWNGLNRFDGYTFKTFSAHDQQYKSLGNNFIHDMDEDHFGNLWIATDEGLHVYLYERNQFRQYLYDPDNPQTISWDKVNCVLVDAEENLWIGSDRGLDMATVTGADGGLEVKYHFPGSNETGQESDFVVQDIYLDQSERIWIGTDNGLALLDQTDFTLTSFTFQEDNEYSLSNNNVQAILQDHEGLLWIGTSAGLNRFDIQTNRFYRYFHDPANEYSLVHNSVEDIIQDPNGTLVIGTLGGLSVFDRSNQRFYNYGFHTHTYPELNNEFVNCLYADQEGNVWIGTERGGINQYNVHQNEFEYILSFPGEGQSLSNNTINSVWEDEEALWVGTAGGGLNQIEKSTGYYFHYQHDTEIPFSISSDFITCIHRDHTGNLLIGTWGGGLNLLTRENKNEGRFIHLQNDPEDDRTLINDFVSSIVEDRYGTIWIGTFGGLMAYHPESREFTRMDPGDGGPEITKVGCLDFDLFSNLWVGTEDGLYFIPADDHIPLHLDFLNTRTYLHDSEKPGSLSGNYIISIYDDNYGNLWFGTYGNGLNKLSVDSLNGDLLRFSHYSEADGLCNNTIYGIEEDHLGNLWLSTDNGLSRFHIERERFTNYFMVDGLLHNQFYWSSSFRNASGRLYFGSMKGLLTFSPEKIKEQGTVPGVILTDFKIYNQSVDVGAEFYDEVALEKPISVSDQILLSYKIKEFSLDFSALYYEHPDKVHYAYKMEGFDEDWRYVSSSRRYASYTNLKGGLYTFKVKSSLSEGYFNSEPLDLNIRILPPLWVKPWFIVTLILILISSVISYNRFRVYSLRRRQKELEKLVATRTAQIRGQKEQLEQQNLEILQQRDKLVELNRKVQLSNQQQMRFFTHMSHEFKTPLTLVIAPLEQMITEVSSRSPYYKTLVLVKRNAQRLLHLVNQLMEVRRIHSGKMELRASKEDLVGFVENITQSFYSLAEQKEIIYEFNAYPGSLQTYFDRDKIENMLYNLLSNAFKYTPEGGQIIVNLGVVKGKSMKPGDVAIIGQLDHKQIKAEEYAEITVKDTGYGIEEDQLKAIFKRFFKIPVSDVPTIRGTGIGLYLTKELIRTHKGQLYINSRKGEGTIFTILIPLGSNFLELHEIIETPDQKKVIPKLHVDLLSGQIEQQKTAASRSRPLLSDRRRSNSLILIIDDDPDMMRFTADYLGENFRVQTAHNGMEGLEKAREYLPDLIISDIMMPQLDGIELCEKLKSDILTSHIPIILLTSRSEAEDYLEGLEVGALDFIAKPFDIKILEAKVHNHINNQENLKRLYTSTQMEDLQNVRKVKVQDPFLNNVIRTIEENMFRHQFGVKELADELCISRSLLHKKLISSVEQSASSFINSIRLKKAALLLLEGEQKVSEVAFEVGFNDPKYFSKMFKKHFGATPSEFVESKISVN